MENAGERQPSSSLMRLLPLPSSFFFFNDTATTEIYTLSLHDALPISGTAHGHPGARDSGLPDEPPRSEEHTSELQSPCNLVCRLLLEKKKNKNDCKWTSNKPPLDSQYNAV